jgi:spore coat protein U-like protein
MNARILAALGAGATLLAPAAFGAGSNSLTPSATVVGQCKVTSPPGILNFGTIDPSGIVNVTASTSFSMKCTRNTLSTAASDNGGLNFSGTKRMKHSVTATAFLPYALVYSGDTGFTGQGFGAAAAPQTVTVTGTITPAQFQRALVTTAAQLYSDTVTITVNP